MFKTLLLGLGNYILTDDAIGLHIAEHVRQRMAGSQRVAVAQTTEMGLALLDLVVGYNNLVLVDAVQTGRHPPGFLHEIGLEQLKALPAFSPHFLGISEVLALGSQLGLAVPAQITIFAIEVQDPFTVGTKLTSALQAALPRLVDQVATAVQRLSNAG